MKRPKSSLPSKDDLLAFIGKQPGKVGTREIARAFGLKNADRAVLKQMLRELADEGRVERRRKKLHQPGTLPHVVLADITARDRDGELIAVPVEWDEEEHGEPPKIRIAASRRARPGEAGGVGDRALLRIEAAGDDGDAIRHTGRIIKIIDRAKQRVLGVFRALPGGGGRLAPIDKKQLGRELAIAPDASLDAKDGDLVAVEVAERRSGYGLASARVKEKLGSLESERAVSLIAIHAHGIPHVFPPAVLKDAEAAVPATLAGREDWRKLPLVTIDPPDAKDHDDAVHAEPDTDPKNPRRLHHQRRDCGCRPLCAAGFGDGPRSAHARQLGLFPRSRRPDAAGADFQRSLFAPAVRRPRRARSPHGDRRRRPQAQSRLSPRDDAFGRQAALRAGAGRRRRLARRHHRPAARHRSSSRSTPPTARSSVRATIARRSISICRNARSC